MANKFITSKQQTKSFEVNTHLVYAMRSIGKGHSGAKKFCTLMNMPPPPTARAFTKNARTITEHVKLIAKQTMSIAATEIRNAEQARENDVANCAVSCDGTWQERGNSSQKAVLLLCLLILGRF